LFGDSRYQYVFDDDEEAYPIDLGAIDDVDDLVSRDRVGGVQEDLVPAPPLPAFPPVASLPSDSDSSLSDCVGSVPSPMSDDSDPDVSPSLLQSPGHPMPVQRSLDTELGVVRPTSMSRPVKFLKCDSPSRPSPSPPPAPVPCPPRESPVSAPVSSSLSLTVPESPSRSPSVPGTPFTPPVMSHRRESITKSGPRNPDVPPKPSPALASQGIVTRSGRVLGSTR
jgi:hypothetical protein